MASLSLREYSESSTNHLGSRTNNAVIFGPPGAGKSTSIANFARGNPSELVVLLTYSKRLQGELNLRLAKYKNVRVFTIHGLASQVYGTTVHNDIAMQKLVCSGAPMIESDIPPAMNIFLDEFQDTTPTLYRFLCAYIIATRYKQGFWPRIVVLGDPHQAIHQFRGADPRNLEFAPEIFSLLSPQPWILQQYTNSYRLSYQNSKLITEGFLQDEQRIDGTHHGPKPVYLHAGRDTIIPLANELMKYISEYGAENTAILAPTLKWNWLLCKLENILSKRQKIPSIVFTHDLNASLDEDVLNGKLTFSTYHQYKGSERDLVIVFGADDSYFRMARDVSDDSCPNPLYVALTRAKSQLIIVQSDSHPAMPFVNWNAVLGHAIFMNLSSSDPKPQTLLPGARQPKYGLQLPRRTTVTDLLRHVIEIELHELVSSANLEITKLLTSPSGTINTPHKVCTNIMKNRWEPVADINGVAILSELEYLHSGDVTTLGKHHAPIPVLAEERVVWHCQQAARFQSKHSGFVSREFQLRNHRWDWLRSYMPPAIERLQAQLPPFSQLLFDTKLSTSVGIDANGASKELRLLGRPDIVNVSSAVPTIWEIKFVSRELGDVDVAQAVFYAYQWSIQYPRQQFPEIILFNVRDGQKWQIRTNSDAAERLLQAVCKLKYTSKSPIPTPQFISERRQIALEELKRFDGFKAPRA